MALRPKPRKQNLIFLYRKHSHFQCLPPIQRKKDAHVREVTCMDLPLDWNNIFNSDVRTQGVHAESIPDALIMSLNTLGKVDIECKTSLC